MALEIEGKLTHLLDRRTGVSSSGSSWASQDFVIEIPGQYPQSVFNDRVPIDQFQIGENIKVSFDIRGHEYQGRWYNTLNAWKIERIGVNAPVANTQPAGQTQAANQPTGPVEQPVDSVQESDLPF